ncbi:hypothetical protein FRC96_07925 [Lujinxingia vulgaris]|uniref:Uncharacterized protein n=1 Tax=Lujinxingia vulgaris TaxID=2600176 RepID=A0A5C6XBZ9_9DELT|nr:hypothetical protein [Lujinxingia vulgaris]TXD37962.1 hypothetical protein FRC96_07925 [Lujinxingia vulgaris]
MSRTTVAKPFLVPSEQSIVLEEWLAFRGMDVEPLQEHLQEWDRSLVITPGIRLALDWPQIQQDIGFSSESPAELRMWTEIETGTTGSKFVVATKDHELPPGTQGNIELRLDALNGGQLASTVTLKVMLTFQRANITPSPGSPWLSGSILWEASCQFDLDGDLRGFPVHPLAFSETFPGRGMKNAPWYVSIARSEPDAPFMSSVVVFVNTARQDVADALKNGSGPLERLLNADVVRTITTAVVNNESLGWEELEDSADGTLGAEVYRWLLHAGNEAGHDTVEEMVQFVREEPHRFGAVCHSIWGGNND